MKLQFTTQSTATCLSKVCTFLGKLNEKMTEIFLPGQSVFIYYNDALEDLPIVFDTRATILVMPDIKDFITYDETSEVGITNITGSISVKRRGTVK